MSLILKFHIRKRNRNSVMVTELWIYPAAETFEFLGLPQKPLASVFPHSGASVLRGTFLTCLGAILALSQGCLKQPVKTYPCSRLNTYYYYIFVEKNHSIITWQLAIKPGKSDTQLICKHVTGAKNIKTSVLTDTNRNYCSKPHIPLNQVGCFQP